MDLCRKCEPSDGVGSSFTQAGGRMDLRSGEKEKPCAGEMRTPGSRVFGWFRTFDQKARGRRIGGFPGKTPSGLDSRNDERSPLKSPLSRTGSPSLAMLVSNPSRRGVRQRKCLRTLGGGGTRINGQGVESTNMEEYQRKRGPDNPVTPEEEL